MVGRGLGRPHVNFTDGSGEVSRAYLPRYRGQRVLLHNGRTLEVLMDARGHRVICEAEIRIAGACLQGLISMDETKLFLISSKSVAEIWTKCRTWADFVSSTRLCERS